VARTAPFEQYPEEYDHWFDKNRQAYRSELGAVSTAIGGLANGLEIGVGSGRFAAPLGIAVGVEPSLKIGLLARSRGIKVIRGTAEALPISGDSFGFVLLVTTICFLDDMKRSLEEAYRVIKPAGLIVIGLVEKNSALGKYYQAQRNKSPFYRQASFYSGEEVVQALRQAGFSDFRFNQTLYRPLRDISRIEPVRSGYGQGAFITVTGSKAA